MYNITWINNLKPQEINRQIYLDWKNLLLPIHWNSIFLSIFFYYKETIHDEIAELKSVLSFFS